MSIENDTGLPQDPDQPETPATPTADPNAITLSREQYENLIAKVSHLEGAYGALAGTRVAAPAAPPEPEITEQQLAQMFESGDGEQMYRAQKYMNDRAMRAIRGELEQDRNAVFQLGTTITERQMRSEIPEYHKDPAIRRDVDALLNTLHPAARANPQAWELAYRQTLADPKHLDRVINARVEEALRQRNGGTQVSDPAHQTAGRRTQSNGGVPSPEEVFGEAFVADMRAHGLSEDQLAQKYGHKNWAEYYASTENKDEWDKQWE